MKIILTLTLWLCLAGSAAAQEGYATWYSVGSCLREGTSGVWTASGEPMRDDALTCAMWNVPFGTMLRVSAGSRSVICKVNDRGPGRGARARGVVVDLSPAAFSELAPLRRGKIAVNVQEAK